MNKKKIKVFMCNNPRVLIGSNMYESDANMPNGVNIYLGELLKGE